MSDRSRKWQPAHAQLVAERNPRTDAEREAVLADLADLRAEPMEVVEHAVGAPFEGPYCWVIFLDSQGVMRAAAESVDPRLHSKVQKWSRKFRRRR